jgi:octaprenyl-diphosphate synthase
MSVIVNKIKAPIETELKLFEEKFKASVKTEVALLDKIMYYIIKRKGKQMRPMFVFLSAKTFGEVNDSTYTAASLIELLHTATLVHDDVVDDANERRGYFSINALWKNKIAVLVGDYLLSQGLLLSVENNQFQMLKIVSQAVRDMSEGELLQMEKARRLDITEEVYFDVIRKKTASLIAACCASGCHSSNSNDEDVEQMRQFGDSVGIAFQIKDDIFDYGTSEKIGKPTGIDIKEKKMTLPLIYTLNNVEKTAKKRIINTIKNHNTDKIRVQEVIELVISTGGIKYAEEQMHFYKDKALNILNQFPESDAKTSLELLVNYSIERDK